MIEQVSSKSTINMALNLAAMQETGELCDFTMTVGQTEICAHKCILAASCEYFRTSFRFSGVSESSTGIDLTHLDCPASIVEKIIRSFYTNEIDLDTGCAESVLRLVDYFMSEELRHCVEVFLEKTLSLHNAVLYFQLALQYRLNNTSLFQNAQCILWYRFHDFFIYHPDALDSCLEVLNAFHEYRLFHFCTPLQVMEFLLTNLKTSISGPMQSGCPERSSTVDSVERVQQTFSTMTLILHTIEKSLQLVWKPLLINYLTCLDMSDLIHGEVYECLMTHLEDLKKTLESAKFTGSASEDTEVDSDLPFGAGDVDHTLNNVHIPNNRKSPEFLETNDTQVEGGGMIKYHHRPTVDPSSVSWQPSHENLNTSFTVTNSRNSAPLLSPRTEEDVLSECKFDHKVDETKNENSLQSKSQQCEVLVLLAPSSEMSSQINAVDAGNVWPLINHPQLELAFYDVELKTWRQVEKFIFPVQGAMLDKHAWRMAFFNGCIYLFSLVKSLGLEYNLTSHSWTHLKCAQLFLPHSENSPVKSIIPISVVDKLIVLSMSRQARIDGTFWTQQDFHAMDIATKTFRQVGTVQDERMDLPTTQWTVSKNLLITIKSSTMMYRHLSRIQYIHIFDANTYELKTHSVVCAMESGVKVLARGKNIYLVDKEGWCRSYDLKTSEWTGLSRYPNQSQSSFASPYAVESVYPALTRVTCHAGSSRWEITTCHTACNAYLQETVVNREGSLSSKQHPPPPFQFFTSMCPGLIDGAQLRAFHQARFEFSESKNY